MNLVDSCGWLEYFADGKNAKYYEKPILDIQNLIVPTICQYEVFKSVLNQKGEDAALQAVSLMQQGHVVELNTIISLRAAKISVEMKLPMADSIIVATAQLHDALIYTQDADFKGIDRVNFISKK